MKTTIITAAHLLFAAIACAAPLTTRAGSATIVIKTGDGDAATTLTVPLDSVTATSSFNSAAVAASVQQNGVFCQAFSDAAATKAVGTVFSVGNDVSFSASSDGGVDSNAADAVDIGAYLCSNSVAGVAAKGSNGNNNNNSGSNNNNSGMAVSSGTVRVQLEQVSDQFVQANVPLDGSLFTGLGNQGLDLAIISATGANVNKVACQAVQDAAGTIAVGGVATAAQDAVLSNNRNAPSLIAGVVCGVFK